MHTLSNYFLQIVGLDLDSTWTIAGLSRFADPTQSYSFIRNRQLIYFLDIYLFFLPLKGYIYFVKAN